MKIFIFSIFVTCLLSCQESRITSNSTLRISVNCNSMENINASEYFENVEVIQLETSKKSLIFGINCLYFHKDSLYIFIKNRNQFSSLLLNGMFIRKICHIGKGPGEYMQISDFTIDENKNEILISAEIPKAVFKYDLTGNFITRFKVNNCYGARISEVGNKIVLASVNKEYDFVLHEYNKNTGKFIKSSMEKCINSYNYPQIDSHFPNLVKSSSAFYNQPISGEIYSIDDSVNFSKYSIDFGITTCLLILNIGYRILI
ncbi:MAG: 6-bladed beta-propeller [Breznakibacter sp.]